MCSLHSSLRIPTLLRRKYQRAHGEGRSRILYIPKSVVGRHQCILYVWASPHPWYCADLPQAKDLITHLLCVDPAKRYTIDEFLAHPWCREVPGSMPPPKTPGYSLPLDSPLLRSVHGVAVARSPGLATLKEAFDITYAVHRMEEEGARRGRGGAFLGDLDEEDEDEDGDAAIVSGIKSRGVNGSLVGTQGDAAGTRGVDKGMYLEREAARGAYQEGRAGVRDRGDRKRGFELNLGGATLLG
jgi:serine/threonine-protein kinase RCK2